MINITLICAAGMSTSMLMAKMEQSAIDRELDVHTIAMSESSFEGYSGSTDILLLGPQISYLEDEIRNKYEGSGMKIKVIDMMDYGMMNGEKVLDDALSMID